MASRNSNRNIISLALGVLVGISLAFIGWLPVVIILALSAPFVIRVDLRLGLSLPRFAISTAATIVLLSVSAAAFGWGSDESGCEYYVTCDIELPASGVETTETTAVPAPSQNANVADVLAQFGG